MKENKNFLHKIIHHIKQDEQQNFVQFNLNDFLQQLKEKPFVRPTINFPSQLKEEKFFLICEVKKASPSQGVIRKDYHPVKLALSYQAAGASAISVLTEQNYFLGKKEHLTEIRAATTLPILRKDFIFHEKQVADSYLLGADLVLLIASCLSKKKLQVLYSLIIEMGMTPLVEIHAHDEIEKVLSLTPTLIGINNRNLHTFEINLQHCIEIKKLLPSHIDVIAESGISTVEDIMLLQEHGFKGALIGEAILRQADTTHFIKTLASVKSS